MKKLAFFLVLLILFLLILFYGTVAGIEIVRQKNIATIIAFPIVDADGDAVTGAGSDTPDSEIEGWTDGAAPTGFTDCTNEITSSEVTTASGWYSLSLTQAEMNEDYIMIQIKTATAGTKTQHILIRTIEGDPLALATVSANYKIAVNSAGDVGIDLDNVSGTLSDAEIQQLSVNVTQFLSSSVPVEQLVEFVDDSIGLVMNTLLTNLDEVISTRSAIGDTIQRDAAVAGDAMTLTTAERVAVADSVADNILTGATHNIPTSLGRRLRQLEAAVILATGTAQRGDDSSVVLASATSESDDYFNNTVIQFVAGTGMGQSRFIMDYTGASDSVSLDAGDPWTTNPDNTSEYQIIMAWPMHVAHIHTDVIDADALADDAIDYATFAASAPTAWWNEGKTGYALTTAERKAIADSVHFADTTQYSGSDTTMGQMIIMAATLGDTNTNPFDAGTDDVFLTTNYQTAADSFWLADTSQYSGDDDSTMAGLAWRNKNLFDNQGNWATATGFAVKGDPMTLQSDSLKTLMGDVDAIKAKTDNLPVDPADDSDIDGQLATIQTDLDNPSQYKATGFAVKGDPMTFQSDSLKALMTGKDSVTIAISDVNKANFKYGGGADSVRAFLATHDSTLLEQAAACGSGVGVRTINITVKDTSDSTAISGFEVDVYDSSSNEYQGGQITNSNGVATFSLDDETYTIHIKKTPWNLASPRYFIVTANMDSTFYASAFDPGSPASPSKCRVYVTKVTDVGANDLAGCRLAVWIPGIYFPVTYGGSPISPYAVYGVSNAAGYVYVDVYRSADIVAGNGETVKMLIRLTAPNGAHIAEVFAEIPNQGSWEIDWTP